jgi:hypothetical protein
VLEATGFIGGSVKVWAVRERPVLTTRSGAGAAALIAITGAPATAILKFIIRNLLCPARTCDFGEGLLSSSLVGCIESNLQANSLLHGRKPGDTGGRVWIRALLGL